MRRLIHICEPDFVLSHLLCILKLNIYRDLSGGMLVSLTSGIFSPLLSISNLYLYDNAITGLPSNAFSNIYLPIQVM